MIFAVQRFITVRLIHDLSHWPERGRNYMKDLSGLEVKDYFRILWNRRWYFLIVFALISIGGTLYSIWQPDVYRSETRIMVDIPLSAISRSASNVRERKDAIREHLYSRSFIEKMIQQTGLYGWGYEGFVMERAVNAVRNTVKIDNISDVTFRISYRATDPALAQNVTSQFAEELMRVSRRSAAERMRTVDKFVEARFIDAEENLKKQEEKIRQFKQRNAGKLPEQVVGNTTAIAGYRQQLTNVDNAILQAKNSKDLLDYQYNTDRQTRSDLEQIRLSSSANTTVVPKDASPEERDFAQKKELLSKAEANLVQALTKYTENHPDIAALKREIGRLEQEVEEARVKISAVPVEIIDESVAAPPLTTTALAERLRETEYTRRINNLEAEIARREQEREDILKQINEYEARVKTAPTLEQELDSLYREEALLKKEYENYATQKLNAGLATAVETASDNEVYRVVDPANYPNYPESPNRKELIMITIGAGLLIGIAAAFGRELLDTTIGSEEEAKKVFNLPVLAAIPSAPKKSRKAELRKTA